MPQIDHPVSLAILIILTIFNISRLSHTLPAYGYWNVQFYQMEAAYVHFDLWLPRGASLGFYARRNALPTHTNYDLMEVIKGASTTEARPTRSVQVRKCSS